MEPRINDNISIKYEIKDDRLHFNFECKECGTISNSIPYSIDYNIGEILQSYLIKHSRLHELAETGELTKKFVSMVERYINETTQ